MKEGKAYKYAVWCSTEQEGKVPEYVKKQAESWLHIAEGNDEDAYVDEQEYEKICKLLKLMVHPDLRCSIYDGLEDYAWFMIVAGLCTYCRNSEQRSRFYVTILLEIARKNFKTFNSAVIFILLMLTEPDFSRFFSVAPDLQLSSELKNAIRKIIKVSPALYDEDEPAFKVLRSQIICLLNENEYTPLAYSQDGMDGKLANAYLADEAGALDDYPVEAMRSSQITLFNNFDVLNKIIQYMAKAISVFIEHECLIGTTGKAEGLTKVTRGITAAAADKVKADELIDVQESIPDTYQSGAVWIMNKATRTAIRKLKDSDGNYLLNRDVSARWGYTLLGKDVYCSDAMPKMAAKATAVYYGDFSGLAVKVAEDANIEVLREKYATQHAVGVVAWMEIDTKVEDSQKIAKLTMASA